LDPHTPASRLDGSGARQGNEAAEAEAGPPFADLLAPPVPIPVPPPATPTAPATGEGDAPAGGTDPAAPGQLLALLDGYRLDAIAPAGGRHAPGAAGANVDVTAALAPAATAAAMAGQATTAAAGSGPALQAALDVAGPTPAAFPLAAAPATPDSAAALPEAMPAPAATSAGAAPDVSAAAIAPPPAAARPPLAAPQLPPLSLPGQPSDGFDDGFGARMAWMAGQRLGHAEIRLNPEHLGVIDVRLQLDGEQVRAEFNSASTEVRQAIEASLPRLRELLGQQGLQLGQADVGQRQPGGDADDGRTTGHAGSGRSGGGSDATARAEAPAPSPLRTRGLVDEYA